MEDITGGERGPAAAELRRRFAASFELRTKRLMEDCARNEEGTECRHFRSVEMPVIGTHLAATGLLALGTGAIVANTVRRGAPKLPRIVSGGLGLAGALSTWPFFSDLSYFRDAIRGKLMDAERSVFIDCICNPLLEIDEEGPTGGPAGDSGGERRPAESSAAEHFGGGEEDSFASGGGLQALFEREGRSAPAGLLERLRECKKRRSRMEEREWMAATGRDVDGLGGVSQINVGTWDDSWEEGVRDASKPGDDGGGSEGRSI